MSFQAVATPQQQRPVALWKTPGVFQARWDAEGATPRRPSTERQAGGLPNPTPVSTCPHETTKSRPSETTFAERVR